MNKVLAELATNSGITIEELLKPYTSKNLPASKVRYINPANPDQSWSGRGRPPKWYKDHISNGVNKDEMKISV